MPARRDLWVPAVIVAIAFAVRIVGIGQPDEIVFDEIYYAQDACWYLYQSPALCGVTGETSSGHPPLGKWLIAGGIQLFGYNPFGWRVMAAVAGTLTVLGLYGLTHRLLRSMLAAALAAGLLAFDLLHIVHSRVAMLDGFLTLFEVAALYFAVCDRDDLVRRGAFGASHEGRWRSLRRPWRLLAGFAAGLAIATKWPGLYMAVVLVCLTVVWEVRVRGVWKAHAVLYALREMAWSLILSFLIIPATVYAFVYLGRLPGALLSLPWHTDSFVRSVLSRQLAMLRYHLGFFGDHPYQSPPWSWLLLKRPIVYFFSQTPTVVREILALGNPVVWWAALAAALCVGIAAARHRDVLAPELPLIAAVAATYGPWFVLVDSRSFMFLYYVLPTVPYLCAVLACAVSMLRSARAARAASAVLLAAAVAGFVYYYPILTAAPISEDAWRARLRPFGRCGTTVGPPAPGLPVDRSETLPKGWCWL